MPIDKVAIFQNRLGEFIIVTAWDDNYSFPFEFQAKGYNDDQWEYVCDL